MPLPVLMQTPRLGTNGSCKDCGIETCAHHNVNWKGTNGVGHVVTVEGLHESVRKELGRTRKGRVQVASTPTQRGDDLLPELHFEDSLSQNSAFTGPIFFTAGCIVVGGLSQAQDLQRWRLSLWGLALHSHLQAQHRTPSRQWFGFLHRYHANCLHLV